MVILVPEMSQATSLFTILGLSHTVHMVSPFLPSFNFTLNNIMCIVNSIELHQQITGSPALTS